MNAEKRPQNLRVLSIGSILLAVLGGAFYWWVPLGIVVSLAGLAFGFVDWESAARRSLDSRLSIAAILLAFATLALDIVIAVLGLQTWTFGGQ